MNEYTPDTITENITHQPEPRKRSKPKAKAKPKVKAHKPKPRKAAKKAKKARQPASQGQYARKCALSSCRKPFRTDDKRKMYHSRACGNKQRSRRWYAAAADALRKLRKSKKV